MEISGSEYTELGARIEALARLALGLTAALEMQGIIDGPRFSSGLRSSLQPRPDSGPVFQLAEKRLHELVDQLDQMRSTRQTRA